MKKAIGLLMNYYAILKNKELLWKIMIFLIQIFLYKKKIYWIYSNDFYRFIMNKI